MSEAFTEIFRGNHLQAEIIASMLTANGIRVLLSTAGTSAAYPLTVGALGEGRVSVLARDESEARRLLADAEPAARDPDES